MRDKEKSNDNVRAVDRALEILMAFAPNEKQLSASELLKRVHLSRATLYRLLRTLESNGFITVSGEPQQFSLGPSIGYLSNLWNTSLDLAEIAQPMLHKLWMETGETVALFTHQGFHRVCIAELPSPNPLSFKRGIGYSEHVTVGASGRVIVANLSNPETFLNHKDASKQIDTKIYLEYLKEINVAGFAVSNGELIKGAVAIAAPVFNNKKKVIGSIAVFGPSARIDDRLIKNYAALLQQEAANITKTFEEI